MLCIVFVPRIMHTPVGTMECSPQPQDVDGTSRDDQDNFTNRYVLVCSSFQECKAEVLALL
jgi:hypothetical protein